MTILNQLLKNKGKTSTKLGKALAGEILNGNIAILKEAIEYALYEPNNEKQKMFVLERRRSLRRFLRRNQNLLLLIWRN